MIISKKRFQEEIAKSVREREEKIYRDRELQDDFRYVRQEIDELKRRVFQLEEKAFPSQKGCECVTPNRRV